MVLQVLKPTPQKGQLEAISQALGIARSVYGIVGDSKNLDALNAKAEKEARIQSGDLTPIEAAELSKKTGAGILPEKTPGSFPITVGGEERFLDPAAEARAKSVEKALGVTASKSKGEDILRKEYNNEKKEFEKVFNAYDRIDSISQGEPSAAGDLSLIFNFMKMLDPGSVVRESEFRNAEQAKAWLSKSDDAGVVIPSSVRTAIQKADPGQKGAFLLPQQRGDFVGRALELRGAATSGLGRIDSRYIGIAENRGLDQKNIFGGKANVGLAQGRAAPKKKVAKKAPSKEISSQLRTMSDAQLEELEKKFSTQNASMVP